MRSRPIHRKSRTFYPLRQEEINESMWIELSLLGGRTGSIWEIGNLKVVGADGLGFCMEQGPLRLSVEGCGEMGLKEAAEVWVSH